MLKEPAREQLERLYGEFLRQSFPPAHGAKAIEQLHDELILYDADVAAAITAILQSPKPDLNHRKLSGLQENGNLQRLINEFLQTFPRETEIGQTVREYQDYYDLIKKMLQAAHSYLSASIK